MAAGSYRDLLVWQKGMDLAKQSYHITKAMPQDERYGLVSQIRRAAVSIPSNIAEGQARSGTKEFIQFLYIAKGSLAELDTPCLLAKELGYLNDQQRNDMEERINELQRMLHSLITKLNASK